jgi:hypothetical protein
MTRGRVNVQGSDRDAKRTAAPFLRSLCGPQCREQTRTANHEPSVCADIPACFRLCSDNERIGE